MSAKKIVITTGDPAGCGPGITLKAIEAFKRGFVDFSVVGDEEVLSKYPLYSRLKHRFVLIDAATPLIGSLKSGICSRLSGDAARRYLILALKFMEQEKIKRLVTAPLSKEAVQMVEPKFIGHTEYLAGHFKAKRVEMAMVAGNTRMVLFTRHIPLRQVPGKINIPELHSAVAMVYVFLQKNFAIKKPRIAVASLNPHAGRETFLDKEEKIILRAVKTSHQPVYGPFPPDTLFIPANLKKYDCVICLYHDQAMIPFKLLAMKSGVNVTVGLPIVRTSPAHGVAYDLIRKRKEPFADSMIAAIKLALKLKP